MQITYKTLFLMSRQHDLLDHASYPCQHPELGPTAPLPTRRVGREYCGLSAFNPNLSLPILQTDCPVECRPKEHLDWIKCWDWRERGLLTLNRHQHESRQLKVQGVSVKEIKHEKCLRRGHIYLNVSELILSFLLRPDVMKDLKSYQLSMGKDNEI